MSEEKTEQPTARRRKENATTERREAPALRAQACAVRAKQEQDSAAH